MLNSGKKIQPWFYSFFWHLYCCFVPFVSFSSQDILNILAIETAAFIDSRRRKRSWFWSFFPFLSSCLFLFPAPYLATGQRKRPGPPPMSGSGRGSRLWTVGASWGRDLVGAGNQGLPDRGSLSARTSQSTNWPRVTNAWRIGFSISAPWMLWAGGEDHLDIGRGHGYQWELGSMDNQTTLIRIFHNWETEGK